MIKKEHIEEHFIINPYWKEYFLSKFPNWTTDNWTNDVWSLFKDNGYRYELERYSNNPESGLYSAIKCISLIDSNDEEIIGYGNVTESSALEQLMINVICNFDVDFNTFK